MRIKSLPISAIIACYMAPFIENYETPCLVLLTQVISYCSPHILVAIMLACMSYTHQQSYKQQYEHSLKQWLKIRQSDVSCLVLIRNIPKQQHYATTLRAQVINCQTITLRPSHIILQLNKALKPNIGSVLHIKPNQCQLDFDDYHYQDQPLQRYSQALIGILNCPKIRAIHATNTPLNISHRFWQIRGYIINTMLETLTQSKAFGLIAALLFGEQQFITTTQWHALKTTSTAHLVAISGLHIQMIASALETILTRIHSLLSPRANKNYINALVISMITMYYALSGLSYSCQRALLMYSYKYLCQLTNSHYQPLDALLASAIVAIALHPYCVFNMGFILSYAMVFSLILVAHYQPSTNYFTNSLWTFIAQIPWSYWFWKKFAILSPIGNSFALPWLSYGILPCVLLLIPSTPINQYCVAILLWLIETQWYYLSKLLSCISYYDL